MCIWLYFIKYAPAKRAIHTDTQRAVYLAPGLRYRRSSKKKKFETQDTWACRQKILRVWAVQGFDHLQYWDLCFVSPSEHSVSVSCVLKGDNNNSRSHIQKNLLHRMVNRRHKICFSLADYKSVFLEYYFIYTKHCKYCKYRFTRVNYKKIKLFCLSSYKHETSPPHVKHTCTDSLVYYWFK